MVNALQRSGHHAFVMELLSSTDQHCFLNCISNAKVYRRKFIEGKPDERFGNDMNLDLDAEISGPKARKNLIVFNTEMYASQDAQGLFESPMLQANIGASETRAFVTWMRDPLNNMASLFQIAIRSARAGKIAGRLSEHPKLVKARGVWMDHWQTVRRKDYGYGLVFNRWLRDDDYRRSFYERLDLPMPERFGETSRWGRGSSIARFAKGQAAPSVEDMEARYALFMDDPEFQRLFAERSFVSEIDAFFEEHATLTELAASWEKLRGDVAKLIED